MLLALLAVRILAMFLIPLNDTTEARYAEIARKMLETGNWITPLHDYNVAFWAKPPMSTWFSAASMGVFGVNEFAARLPSLVLLVGVLVLIFYLARTRFSREVALVAVLVLASSIVFLLSAGTAMTDPALLFCVTLSQCAFWYAVPLRRRVWGYIFFAGLGLGLLAKGPLAIVLVGMPIFFWVLVRKQWHALWSKLPWLTGSLLTFAIAAPWYWLAEAQTPGFFNYFIMGEHVARFLDPGWKGDLYGFAHSISRGMIWIYTLAALFPWSLLFIWRLFRNGRQTIRKSSDNDGWLLYIVLWSLMTIAFFTLSRNIIWVYVLPMTPGFALLFATLWGQDDAKSILPTCLAVFNSLLALVVCAAFLLRPDVVGHNQKKLIEAWKLDTPTADSELIYWNSGRAFSAEFYSEGRARASTDQARVLKLLQNTSRDYIAVKVESINELPADIRENFTEIGRFKNGGAVMCLLRERSAH